MHRPGRTIPRCLSSNCGLHSTDTYKWAQNGRPDCFFFQIKEAIMSQKIIKGTWQNTKTNLGKTKEKIASKNKNLMALH